MREFKSISQVCIHQHSPSFSVHGSMTPWPPALTHPGICPEHPTAARLDWDLGNEEAKSKTSHCCWLSLTWNGQYNLRTGYPDHFTCQRSGCYVWSVYSGFMESSHSCVSSHLRVSARFGSVLKCSVCLRFLLFMYFKFFSFAWIKPLVKSFNRTGRPSVSAAEHVVVVVYTNKSWRRT